MRIGRNFIFLSMKTENIMKLTEEQYQSLAEQAADYADAGITSCSVDIGEDTFSVSCETEGYCEDDYFNGTGGMIMENACCRVTDYDQTVFIDEDTEVAVDFDINGFERRVEKLLIT